MMIICGKGKNCFNLHQQATDAHEVIHMALSVELKTSGRLQEDGLVIDRVQPMHHHARAIRVVQHCRAGKPKKRLTQLTFESNNRDDLLIL